MTTDKETPQIISRLEAKEKRLSTYFTGEACCNGHNARRYVVSGACVTCKATRSGLFTAKRRESDPDGFRASVNEGVKRHYERNRDAILAKKKAYYTANAESIKAKAKAKRAAPKADSIL